jgi:mRNA interferase MazF
MSFAPGDVVLIPLGQFASGPSKLRPALLLASLPGPYQTQLVCGISTQLQRQVTDWDELIQPGDADFTSSGLHRASIIRLSYIHATDPTELAGSIGQVDAARLERLLTRLADRLRP